MKHIATQFVFSSFLATITAKEQPKPAISKQVCAHVLAYRNEWFKSLKGEWKPEPVQPKA